MRNPHNIFFSTLGRGGWIVSGLWCLFYLAFVPSLLSAASDADEKSRVEAARRDLPCFYLAALINGGTDVFLEVRKIPFRIGL